LTDPESYGSALNVPLSEISLAFVIFVFSIDTHGAAKGDEGPVNNSGNIISIKLLLNCLIDLTN